MWVELLLSGAGGLVDPVSGDGLSECGEGGLVGFGYDVGVIGLASSGHRRVDAAAVGWGVDVEEGGVDGSALAGVAGLRISKL